MRELKKFLCCSFVCIIFFRKNENVLCFYICFCRFKLIREFKEFKEFLWEI